jgi:hypothetical protein
MTILTAVGEGDHSQAVVPTAYDLAEAYDEDLLAIHVIPQEDFDEHKQALNSIPVLKHAGASGIQRIKFSPKPTMLNPDLSCWGQNDGPLLERQFSEVRPNKCYWRPNIPS